MYAGTFNDIEKAMWQTRHGYEQELGDLWGLPAQNSFHQFFLSTDDPVFIG